MEITQELLEEIKKLYITENKSRLEIEQILNISDYNFRKILKNYNIKKIAKKQLKKDILKQYSINEIIEYFKTHTRKATAEHFNITEQNLKDLMKEYNFHHSVEEKAVFRAKTCQQLYGVYCVFQRADVREHCNSPEAIKKMVNTQRKNNLEKYGVEYQWQRQEVKDKVAKTNLQNWGNEKGWQATEEGRQFLSNLHSSKEYQAKEIETKRKNKSFNISKPEITYKKLLEDIFGADNTVYQYKTDKYPFVTDFYIKSFDLYVELNFHWTHGPHPFNENTLEDITLLNKWEEKAKISNFYKKAIDTWTIRDTKKLQYAINNHLNYLAIYPKNIFIKFGNVPDYLTELLLIK